MKHLSCLVFLVVLSTSNSFADKISKGYQAFEIYNYFEAKRLFEKSLKKHESAASFGLSLIYYRRDNPFHNIDSAYKFINKAHASFSKVNLKDREKYLIYGLDSIAIIRHRELISGELFKVALQLNSVEGFEDFIQKNYWSIRVDSASFYRDSLAFERAEKTATSESYSKFLEFYPTSVYSDEALSGYQMKLYQETTASNTLISYVEFVNKHPENPYKTDAEDKIFEFYTQTGTVQSFEKFIRDCPSNHNVNLAWKKLYNAHVQTYNYSLSSLENFSVAFPEYPFIADLKIEMEQADMTYLLIREDGKWGFINDKGIVMIKPEYEEAYDFYEGLACVKVNERYGYINKSGKLVIPASFDDALAFNEGHAVVEYRGKLGMINRNGEFIISAAFEDLGNLRNGLCYFLKDSLYGYFDSKGIVRIPAKFSQANDFENGKAIVSLNENFGLIDVFGTTYIPMKYEELRKYENDLFLAKQNGFWGLISVNSDTILNFEYDYIGLPNNQRSIVEKNGQFNYVKMNGELLLTTWIAVYSEYKQLAIFKNHYAKIMVDGKFNLIDTTGKKLFVQPKENLGDYAPVIASAKNGKWGYVNAAGNQVIPYNFSYAFSFRKNAAIVSVDPFYGVINQAGNFLVQPYFEELEFINDSLFIAKTRGQLGILTVKGDTLLNFVYSKIELISDKIVKIEEGDNLYYFDLTTKTIWRKEDN